ncbi:hypothetical protein [Agromyces protaetiae]|uniref:hypothetical protein n=1 Tax=Agromyces protaetiae TaxID=2509455 RepID=UPI00312CB7AC
MPVAVSAAFGRSIRAEPGDEFTFRVIDGGAEIGATVGAVLDHVPGGGDLLADLGALGAAAFADDAGVPQHAERRLAVADGVDPETVAASLETDQPLPLSATTRARQSDAAVVATAGAALWFGAAGAAAFALVALGALAAALARSGAAETGVLRALGMTASDQGRARFAEFATLVVGAVVAGTAVGLVAVAVTAPGLARAAVPGASGAAGFAVDWGRGSSRSPSRCSPRSPSRRSPPLA